MSRYIGMLTGHIYADRSEGVSQHNDKLIDRWIELCIEGLVDTFIDMKKDMFTSMDRSIGK
jgi:hypothetical protein